MSQTSQPFVVFRYCFVLYTYFSLVAMTSYVFLSCYWLSVLMCQQVIDHNRILLLKMD